MAISHMTDQARNVVFKMISSLEEEKKVQPEEIKSLEELKERRVKWRDEFEQIEKSYKLRRIPKELYDSAKEKYDYFAEEIDLEILRKQNNIEHRKNYLKRLVYLKVFMMYGKNTSLRASNGQEIDLEDLYAEFLNSVIKEYIEQLKYEQNLLRLQILHNGSAKDESLEKYLSAFDDKYEEDKKINLYDIQKEIEITEKAVPSDGKVDITELTAADLLESSPSRLYNRIFVAGNIKKVVEQTK